MDRQHYHANSQAGHFLFTYSNTFAIGCII